MAKEKEPEPLIEMQIGRVWRYQLFSILKCPDNDKICGAWNDKFYVVERDDKLRRRS